MFILFHCYKFVLLNKISGKVKSVAQKQKRALEPGAVSG